MRHGQKEHNDNPLLDLYSKDRSVRQELDALWNRAPMLPLLRVDTQVWSDPINGQIVLDPLVGEVAYYWDGEWRWLGVRAANNKQTWIGGGTTMATVAEAGPCEWRGWTPGNLTDAFIYLKLYDMATTPSSSDTPAIVMPIPPTMAGNVFDVGGVEFVNGLAFRMTTGIANNDNTAPASGMVSVSLAWWAAP